MTTGSSGESTFDGQETATPGSTRFRDLTLTLVCHPDLRRIGQRVRLFSLGRAARAELHRGQPSFGDDDAAGEPIGDRFVSRRPIALSTDGTGAVLLTPASDAKGLVLEDAPFDQPRMLSAAELDTGVVLELAGRVALLIHTMGVALRRRPSMGMVGNSEIMDGLRGRLLQVAARQAPVLIRGETGVGKELVARAIHAHSPRAKGPLVCVNSASLSAETAISALFGHRRGAFTDAGSDHDGFFARAHGGTLFLDEIGEIPGAVQPMLLRAIETLEIMPLGARQPQRVDVRVIAATDADLESAVARRAFRGPLFHRLAGFQLEVPPLRARPDDIARLAFHFLREEYATWRATEPPAGGAGWMTSALAARLVSYDWPGNARELRNVMRALLVAHDGQLPLALDDKARALLPLDEPLQLPITRHEPQPATLEPMAHGETRPATLDETTLAAVLKEHHWSTTAAAAALGISRTSLYALIQRSPSLRKAADIPAEELRRAFDECAGDVDAMAERMQVSPRGLQLRLRQLAIR